MATWHHWDGDDLILSLRIQPRAAKNEFAGPYNDQYKLRIKAPPVDGKANGEVIAFLAKQFGVPRGEIKLESGETGRNKRVRIHKPLKFPLPINAK